MCLAVPGKILSTEQIGESRLGKVQFGGITREAYLDLVPEAQVGDYVVVHVGFAISRVDEAEAQRTLEMLEEMGGLAEETAAEDSGTPPAN
ncbi:MAG: HypC/HybG/HupF family hydrogenase formation chaperone [Acidobacteriales bacterium]|nr:HypC/HybG/HupF family hydrogenase formation chaperone [Terriglobales bacterium]